jgi:hypothetical protein
MNAQTFEEGLYTPDSAEPTDEGTDSLVVADLDPVAGEEAPLDSVLPPQAPMGETIRHEVPLDAAPLPETPMGEPVVNQQAPLDPSAGPPEALLSLVDSEHFRTRWSQIQGKFVDEPRAAVQQADALVAEVIEQITQLFANESNSLEAQWKEGNDVSTEDLRQALQHYRSFFNRLMV